MPILFCLLKLISDKLNITSIICFLFARNINLRSANENMNFIYHGCALNHSNGTNVVIERNEKCLTHTNKCFWKDLNDVINAVKIGSQLKNQLVAHRKTLDRYFEQIIKRKINNPMFNFEEKAIEIINEPFIDRCFDKEQKNL